MQFTRLTKEELVKQLEMLGDPAPKAADSDSIDELRHGLQVHQIELEMQNRELREVQAELEAARDRYADLYDFAPVGYATFDRKGVIREINLTGATMLGKPRAHVVGVPFSRWVCGEYAAAFFGHVKKALQGRGRSVTELRIKGAAGAHVHVRLESAALEVEDAERGQQFRAALLDVTEQRHAERQVLENQALLSHMMRISTMGEMAAGLAHELNQPLFAIRNFTEACLAQLEKAPPGPEETCAKLRKRLNLVAEQADRAGKIIREMREFVRKDSTRREPLEINRLVSGTLTLLRLESDAGKVRIHLERGRNLPAVEANRLQIEQVMVNLVKNAIEACAENTRREVTIRTRKTTDGVEVSVRDTGPGVSEQVAGELFHPFVTTKPDGMGMGLAICRTIVEGHGGRIEALPGRGAGAIFRFTLPATEEEDG